jgi:hypothetical protein
MNPAMAEKGRDRETAIGLQLSCEQGAWGPSGFG